MIARHDELAVDFIGDDLHVMLETDVIHSLQFLLLPDSSGRVMRIAEDECGGLLISTLTLEVFEIYLVSAVAYTLQFILYHFTATVLDTGEELYTGVCTKTFSPGMQIAFRQLEMAGTTPDV